MRVNNHIELSPCKCLNYTRSRFTTQYYNSFTVCYNWIKKETPALSECSETKDGIIQGKVEDILFLSSPIDEHSKPLLFGKDIRRYSITFSDNWVNYKPDEMMLVEVERRGVGIRHGLWMRTPIIFERNKILTRQTADEIIAAYDTSFYYYANTLHGTTITDPSYSSEYILAVLNSKLITWYYRTTTAEEGKVFAQIKIALIRQLPIYKANKFQQARLVEIVINIQQMKQIDPTTDTSALEAEIDRIVYELYGLTDEEIKIVEGTVK